MVKDFEECFERPKRYTGMTCIRRERPTYLYTLMYYSRISKSNILLNLTFHLKSLLLVNFP